MDFMPRQVPLAVLDERVVARSSDERSSLRALIEFLLASLILAVTAPVIAVACLLVRLTSRGPVLYTQRRLGRGGRCFTIYKIRSMYQDSEPDGPTWSVRGDKRVTAVGRFLRWTHLDELPQLVNILQGDMGLIGPRPERPEIVSLLERVLPEYRRRLLMRPGLTGLAQVLRGPDTGVGSVRQKLDLDLYYLDHRSYWLDLRILLATVLHVLRVPPEIIAWCFGFPLELIGSHDGEAKMVPVSLEVPKTVSEPCAG